MKSIKLQSNDGVVVTVDRDVARCSVFITEKLENQDEGDQGPITLPQVSSKTMEKVLEWAEKNKKNDSTKEDAKKEKNAWEKDFIKNMDKGTLFDIILAANYLDIKGLLDASAEYLTEFIKTSTVEEIRTGFGIENDFSKEEEELTKKENEWCEDK